MSAATISERQQYWLEHLRAAEASDDTIAGYARSKDLKPKDLYMWKGILARRGLLDSATRSMPKSEFIEVVPAKPQPDSTQLVVTFPNGVRIECQGSLGGGVLSSLVNAVSQIA
ncbi:MAG: hypothetical protein AAF662_00640 [Pseudomonadota bacterium]